MSSRQSPTNLFGRLTNLNDAASELIAAAYPNGWDESYTYDAAGQLLTQLAKDPTNTPSKEILHTYAYDPAGNVTHEYRSGANGQTKYDYTHTYDALNRLTQTTGLWGYATHISTTASERGLQEPTVKMPGGRK